MRILQHMHRRVHQSVDETGFPGRQQYLQQGQTPLQMHIARWERLPGSPLLKLSVIQSQCNKLAKIAQHRLLGLVPSQQHNY
mmetsp:Transcript_34757/g.65440  ORF Transcript_34757/g.65440 Transcript_34757/m.65440 type:complete len:82 (+) Transcript_34757:2679-2924(+)